MATKKQSVALTATSSTKVTRITAGESNPKAAAPQPAVSKARRLSPKTLLRPFGLLKFLLRPLRAPGGYFKGAWFELRQVHWPNRRATWGMTGALLGFTAFFVTLILLMDALFDYLFKLMLGT